MGFPEILSLSIRWVETNIIFQYAYRCCDWRQLWHRQCFCTSPSRWGPSPVLRSVVFVSPRQGYKVYAVDRQVGDGLKNLTKAEVGELDVTSTDSISSFKKTLGDQPIHLLLNIAGKLTGALSPFLSNVHRYCFASRKRQSWVDQSRNLWEDIRC